MAKATPLAAHRLFRSSDLDETRESVARIFCPHRLEIVGRGRFDAMQHHLRGESLSLNYIAYGADVAINPGALEDFYLVQIPLAGGAAIENGSFSYETDTRRASVLNPHLPTRMRWSEGTKKALVQIDKNALTKHLATMLGGGVDRRLTFEGPMDTSKGKGAALSRLVRFLISEIDQGRSCIGTGCLMGRQMESTLMTGLIEAVPNNYSGVLTSTKLDVAPRKLRAAETFIRHNLDKPISLAEIADAAGTTPRSLQEVFRKFRETSPLAYWRDMRLDRVRADLVAGQRSVTEVAMTWGFTHLGRFSEAYRERFGELPSETRARAR